MKASPDRILVKLSLNVQILGALVLGILAGTVGAHFVPPTALEPWLSGADAVIRVWTNALRLVVTPLVVAQIFVAIASHRGAKADAVRLGLLIPAVFIGLMVFVALLSIATTLGSLGLPLVKHLSLTGLDAGVVTAPGGDASGVVGLDWVNDLVPSNLFAAASSDSILALMLFALVFALAARRLAPDLQQLLDASFRAVRDAMFVLVEWLVRAAPLPLFALAFRVTSHTGLEIGRIMLVYAALLTVVALLSLAALYPIATLGGGIPLGPFARAVFPAQVIAATTRSSLASLPTLLREAEVTLRLPSKVSALVIPLGGALLKVSRSARYPAMLLFLAHLLGVPLGLRQIAIFTLTIILLSPTTTGLPNMVSGTRTIPAFVSAGIPPQYVILLGVTATITDVVVTILNTTAYLTADVLVARLFSRRPALANEPWDSSPASETVAAERPAHLTGNDPGR